MTVLSGNPRTGGSRRAALVALAVGIAGTLAVVLSMIGGSLAAFESYRWAWVFWLTLSVGGALVLAMHAVTGGVWGIGLQPLLLAGAATLPWMGALALPWLLGWGAAAGIGWPAAHLGPGAAHLRGYMAAPWFWLRAVAYFVIWTALLPRLAPRTAGVASAEAATRARSRRYAAVAVIVYAATFTLATVDWIMALEAPWASTVYGFDLAIGAMLGTFGLALVVPQLTAPREFPRDWAGTLRFPDLGNLTLAFVLLWAYLGFSQLLVIWTGDLPRENVWYLRRSQGGWLEVGIAAMLAQFALPFLALLSRTVKRHRWTLAAVGVLVLAGHALDLYWIVSPSYAPRPFAVRWQDVVAFLGLGGLWLVVFFRALDRPGFAPYAHAPEPRRT